MPIPARSSSSRLRDLPLTTWMTVAAFCTLWIMLGSFIVPTARQHDFLSFYTGASFAQEGNFADLYSTVAQFARERQYAPELQQLVPFIRPPFYAALLSPLAVLPFGTAFLIWLGMQTAGLLGVWWWCSSRWDSDGLILASLFLPTALGIAHGQDCIAMLAIVTSTYVLVERGRDSWAGTVLGLGLIKFHLFLLWPLALALNRRWPVFRAAAASAAMGLLLSTVFGGPSGIEQYFLLLRRKDLELLEPSPELMIGIHSLTLNLGVRQPWIVWSLILIVAAMTAWACWRAPVWRWVAASCTGSLLVAPHVYGYDAALLLTPLLLAVHAPEAPKSVRITAFALMTPAPFLMALGGSPWSAATPIALVAFLVALGSSPKFQPTFIRSV